MASTEVLHRCTYFVEKKKRTCRLLAKEGAKFCGEHSIYDETVQTRIPCPNNPKHSVSVDELEEHLQKRCNNRHLSVSYISPNLNCVGDHPQVFIRSTFEDLQRTASIIEKVYAEIAHELTPCVLTNNLIAEHLKEVGETLSDLSKKHLIQLSSIIAHVSAQHLIAENANNCFVEFGSGKAHLSYWLMKAFPNANFLLIDRMGARNKFDNKARRENESLKVKRLRCSIEHLDLSKVDFVKEEAECTLTAVCKHLCGNATDFGLKCILNSRKSGTKFNGFAFAPCCHHRTLLHEYIGTDYLRSIGLGDGSLFCALRHICSWSTCGFGNANLTNVHTADGLEAENEYQQLVKDWSTNYKIALGKKAKLILEYGRAEFLRRSENMEIKIFAYVPWNISPENILIIGKFPNC